MSVEKVSVSLPQETLVQMEYLRIEHFHAPRYCKRSQLLQWIVSDLYYRVFETLEPK